MSTPKRYELVYDREWEPTPLRNVREQCCDCGLVHVVDYKIVHNGKKHELLVRVRRDDRATKRMRTRNGIVFNEMKIG